MMTSEKVLGFYAGMPAYVLAIAAIVRHGMAFPDIEYKGQVFDVRICVILTAADILTAVLLLTGEWTVGFAPALLYLGSGVALMLFINVTIWSVSDTIYGTESLPQITQLVVCAALIATALVVGETVFYLRKHRPA